MLHMTKVDDELAMKMIRAMNEHDLDTLVSLMPWIPRRREQACSLLRPVSSA